MLGFVAVILLIVVGIHLYLWKRLVRDPMRPGPPRKVGGVVAVVLALLIPATLILTRNGYAEWLAWPGYLWLALMFYLLVILLILEVPRLIMNLVWRARSRTRQNRPGRGTTGDTDMPVEASAAARKRAVDARTTATNADSTSTTERRSTATATSDEGAGATGPNRATHHAARVTGPDGATVHGARTTGLDRATHPGARTTGPDHERHPGARTTGPDRATRDGVDRRLVLARGAAIFAGLTAAGITGYGVRTALGGPRLDRVQIPIAKLPRAMDGTRLAVVSDIHLGPLTGPRHLRRIVEMINSVDADVVCIVGDMVDGSVEELGPSAAALRDIRSRRGAYFVTGNHEYYSGFEQWIDEVTRLGVRPLRNERLEISTRGGVFDLAGVNDLGGAQFGDAPDFERALGDRDTSRPVVLMAHQPVVARDVADYGVDLQISGHTHGGQMIPFNLLVRLQQPVVSGFGKVDGVPVYVTNGAGFWGPPVRVGVPPQVTLIELRTP